MERFRISLQGTGSIHVVPDVTRLEIRISGHFPDYSKAYASGRENTSWIAKILVFNKKPGNLAKNIRFDVEEHRVPVYDDDGSVLEYTADGYDLKQEVKVDLPIDNVLVNNIIRGVGKFVQGAEISVNYTLRDMRPSQLKMLGRAVSDAREKAQIMAEAAGCKLGKVVSIDYDRCDISVSSQARYIHSNAEAKASTAGALDITPDDLVLSDRVDVVFELVNDSSLQI